jgi:hypothetical protein
MIWIPFSEVNNWEQVLMKRTLAAVLIAAGSLAIAETAGAALIGHWTLDNNGAGIQNQGTNGAPSNMVALGSLPTFSAAGGYDGGGYASFNGTNQSLVSTAAGNIGSALSGVGGTPYTFAAWIRATGNASPTTPIAGRGAILGISNTANSAQYTTMEVGYPDTTDSGALQGVWRNTVFHGVNAPGSYATIHNGGWHHAAVVFNSPTSLSIYLDGVLAATGGNATDTYPAGINSVSIGVFQRSSGATDRFTGDIDDARIYDTALTAQEVAALVPEPNALLLAVISTIGIWACRRTSTK